MGKFTADEEKPSSLDICSYCGAKANLTRPEKHKEGYSIPGTIPICWSCWDTVKRPDWRDVIVSRGIIR